MGPTNLALLDLFRADTALRDAQSSLEAATRGVRVQKKRAELARAAHAQTQNRLKHVRAQQMELDSDLKARDARIEHLREQQQTAQNHKQFQSFLVEINTQKLDRGKIEEQAIGKLNEVEELTKLEAEQAETASAEEQRALQLQEEIGTRTASLQAEIDRLEPLRESAAAKVPGKALSIFDRLADNYDGEAMAGIGHIEGRTEGYYCTACNMELVVDIYNRLRTRDDVLSCPGCGRLLYIPEELTPEMAVRQKGKTSTRKVSPRKKTTKKAATKGPKLGPAADGSAALSSEMKRILTTASAESMRQAELDEAAPVDVEVFVAGKSAGRYRAKDADNLRRLLVGKMQAEDIEAELAVRAVDGALTESGSPAATIPRDETAVPLDVDSPQQPENVESSSDVR